MKDGVGATLSGGEGERKKYKSSFYNYTGKNISSCWGRWRSTGCVRASHPGSNLTSVFISLFEPSNALKRHKCYNREAVNKSKRNKLQVMLENKSMSAVGFQPVSATAYGRELCIIWAEFFQM